MKRNSWHYRVRLLSLLVVLVLVPLLTGFQPNKGPKPIEVQILGVNDFHGQLNVTGQVDGETVGRADYLAAYVKKYRKQNPHTLLVHAGDMVGASPPVSSLLMDEPTIEILNKMRFDVGTLGNHEFDRGVKEMKRLIDGGYHPETGYFSGAKFPYTVANVIDEKTKKPILPPFVIKRIQGIPIAFIGVVTKETPTIVAPSGVEGVEFIDEVEAINREVAKLKKKGIRAIVILAHEGGVQDNEGNVTGPIADIARKVDDEVDVIISGHTHTRINAMIDGKLVVQSHDYGKAFSKIDLTLDRRSKDIVTKNATIIKTAHNGIKPDRQIAKMVEGYEKEVAPIINRKVGEAAHPITREQNAHGESALGNLIADAQRWKMEADFSFMNPGGIRHDIAAGEVTWGDLYNVQPFNNQMVTLQLTGDQIRRLLNQQWQGETTRMLQISGLTYTWDGTKPVGERIVTIQKADGTPVEPNAVYTVAVNAFLADGGDNFTVLTEGTNRVVGPVDLDALVDYIKQLPQPFSAEIEGRILQVENET